MATPRGCRFPPTPKMTERKKSLFPDKDSPHVSVLSEISNTPRRSCRLTKPNLTPVTEGNENISPSSHGSVYTRLYLSGDSSDLGHMSPLESSSSPPRYDSPFHNSPQIDSPSVLLARPRFFSARPLSFDEPNSSKDKLRKTETNECNKDIEVDPETPRRDFAGIFKNNFKNTTEQNHYIKLNKSINSTDIESLLDTDSVVIPETPDQSTPSRHLRTPQEIISENLRPPRLKKSFTELDPTSPNIENKFKRRLSNGFLDGPNNKVFKLEETPKARASLFPEIKPLFSAKSFYPKAENNMPPVNNSPKNSTVKKITLRKQRASHVNKQSNIKTRNGQINGGVRHKIRKPRQKKSSVNISHDHITTALDIMDNSPLNDYLKNIDMNQRHSMPASLNNNPPITNDSFIKKHEITNPKKELSITLDISLNENAEPIKGRKFFKNRRTLCNKIVKLQDNLILNVSAKVHSKSNITVTNVDNVVCETFKENEDDMMTKEQKEVQKLLSEWQECEETETDTETQQNLANDNISVIVDSGIASSIGSINEMQIDINNDDKDSINLSSLSPTSQISTMTSFMALDSPILMPSQNEMQEDGNSNQLYPVFYRATANAYEEPVITKTRQKKIWKPNGAQYQIDAGQKRFGATQCGDCGLLYTIADPEEELFHFNYHNSMHVLNFAGWRNECIISTLDGVGRIIHIKFNAPKTWHKRVRDLLEMIDNELGVMSSPYEPSEDVQAYLMANSRQIIGLVVATRLSKANRLISSEEGIDLCTLEEFDVKCGVTRVWMAPPYRGRGIAMAILNAMRCNFMFGRILDLDEIAFSTPTLAGTVLARKFTKRDDFLVFAGN